VYAWRAGSKAEGCDEMSERDASNESAPGAAPEGRAAAGSPSSGAAAELGAALQGTLAAVAYSEDRAWELVEMWRAAFERGVQIIDPHPVQDQLLYLQREVLPNNRVLLVLNGLDGPVVAFLAFSPRQLAQLYVHVDHQRRGIGTALLNYAKAESSGSLRLFTFEVNTVARRFYERNGFSAVGHGFESEWQLADVEYEWRR
jgi:GNAT superfamily N-acetyltransferase